MKAIRFQSIVEKWLAPALGALGSVAITLFSAVPVDAADPATIGLTATGPARVIRGAEVTISAKVRNLAGPTADTPTANANDLEYDITFTHPDGTEDGPNVGVIPADGGQTFKTHSTTFNTAADAFGTVQTLVRVIDPDASNSPQEAVVPTLVLKRAVPLIYITVKGKQGQYVNPVTDTPDLSSEQAAAGGDGPIALATGVVLGDPPAPTANLDLDTLTESGSPELSATFHTFKDLLPAPNDDPAYGLPFDIYLNAIAPGMYTKTWFFGFSDEDIPNARPYGSVGASLTFSVKLVPEPSSLALAILSLLAVIGLMKRGKGGRPHSENQKLDSV